MGTLVVRTGPLAGQRTDVDSDVLIGRQNARLTIPDPEISRRHAVIRMIEGRLEIEDLGSLNGTWVNGHRVTASTGLAAGDEVKVGGTVIVVQLATAPVEVAREQTPPPAPPEPAGTPETYQAPPQPTRRRPAATRGLGGVIVTFTVIGVTAILLVIYFLVRG